MNKNLVQKNFSKIKKTPTDIIAYEDLFSLCRNIESEDFALAHSTNEELRKKITGKDRGRFPVFGHQDKDPSPVPWKRNSRTICKTVPCPIMQK